MPLNSDSNIRGKRVVTNDGHMIGHVEELVVDTETWRVERIGVKLERDKLEALKLKRPIVGSQEIKIAVREIAGVRDEIVLRHKLGELDFAGGQPKK